jgi:protein-histidine N-methyltransferase
MGSDTSSLRCSYEDAPSCNPDFTAPGELAMTLSLKEAFLAALQAHGIVLRFFAGPWHSFDLAQTGGSYDVVLTSETIYRTDGLHSLVNLLARASGHAIDAPKEILDHGDLAESNPPSMTSPSRCLCLVAAKVLYFGVGGGVSEFTRAVEERESMNGKAEVKTTLERKEGVGRRVMKVEWV